MAITREEVEHIANLARIALTEEEKAAFAHDLSSILDFVAVLNAVNTKGVFPMTGGTMRENSLRRDIAEETALEGKSLKLLEAASQKKGSLIRVNPVRDMTRKDPGGMSAKSGFFLNGFSTL